MTVKSRLGKLEKQVKPDLILLTVTQDDENPDLYYQFKSGMYDPLPEPDNILRTWTRVELDALPNHYQVIAISWIPMPKGIGDVITFEDANE